MEQEQRRIEEERRNQALLEAQRNQQQQHQQALAQQQAAAFAAQQQHQQQQQQQQQQQAALSANSGGDFKSGSLQLKSLLGLGAHDASAGSGVTSAHGDGNVWKADGSGGQNGDGRGSNSANLTLKEIQQQEQWRQHEQQQLAR